MFGSIRDKIHNLQENLSTTLRGLSVAETPSVKRPAETFTVNPNAGITLLEKFQSSWCELHEMSQENATKAQEVDDLIFELHKSATKQWQDISHLTGMMGCLPELIDSINVLYAKISSLEGLFEKIEKGLVVLEDVMDEKCFFNKVIEQKFQLAMHEETRLAKLENLRLSLEEKHRKKVKAEVGKIQLHLKDETGINYSKDIKSFKEPIPKLKLGVQADEVEKSLDVIVVENENPKILEEFLNEAVSDHITKTK